MQERGTEATQHLIYKLVRDILEMVSTSLQARDWQEDRQYDYTARARCKQVLAAL